MKFFVTSLINFLMSFITTTMGPLSSFVLNLLPDLTGFSSTVANFFDWLVDFVSWALSWLPFTTGFYVFFALYWAFRLTLPLMVHAIKTVIKWWHALAP